MLHGDNPYQPPEAPLGELRRASSAPRRGGSLGGVRVGRVLTLTAVWVLAYLPTPFIAEGYQRWRAGGEIGLVDATIVVAAWVVLGGFGTLLLALLDHHFRKGHK